MNSGAIRYLSLAAKAGKLVTGGDEVEKQLRRGKAKGLLLLASDAGADAERRARKLATTYGIELTKTLYAKYELAAAAGRGSSVAIALVTDGGLAAAFTAAAATGLEQEESI